MNDTASGGSLIASLLLFVLKLYKRWMSPWLGRHCRFTPSCSEYAMMAVQRYGAFRGALLASWRVFRCQPFCQGGHDPVP